MRTFSIAAALACLFIVGCGKSVTTEPSGSASPASATPAKIAFDNDPKGDVTEANFGVPFYPGSKVAPGNVTGGKGVTDGVFQAASFRVTDDDVAKVTAFYKDALSKAGFKEEDSEFNGIVTMNGTMDGDKEKIEIKIGKTSTTQKDNSVDMSATRKVN